MVCTVLYLTYCILYPLYCNTALFLLASKPSLRSLHERNLYVGVECDITYVEGDIMQYQATYTPHLTPIKSSHLR